MGPDALAAWRKPPYPGGLKIGRDLAPGPILARCRRRVARWRVACGEMPCGEMPSGEMPSGEIPCGETSRGEIPCEETPSPAPTRSRPESVFVIIL